jgi:hypothetical protein
MKSKHIIYTGALVLVSTLVSFGQKKTDGYDKIVFGSYIVTEIKLKEFVISKSGDILFTSRMDKQYTHVGHLEKDQLKILSTYCTSKPWEDFMKFNPGKDYKFVRLYKGNQYIEMIWAPSEASADMNELYDMLNDAALGFPLPEPIMAKKQ